MIPSRSRESDNVPLGVWGSRHIDILASGSTRGAPPGYCPEQASNPVPPASLLLRLCLISMLRRGIKAADKGHKACLVGKKKIGKPFSLTGKFKIKIYYIVGHSMGLQMSTLGLNYNPHHDPGRNDNSHSMQITAD